MSVPDRAFEKKKKRAPYFLITSKLTKGKKKNTFKCTQIIYCKKQRRYQRLSRKKKLRQALVNKLSIGDSFLRFENATVLKPERQYQTYHYAQSSHNIIEENTPTNKKKQTKNTPTPAKKKYITKQKNKKTTPPPPPPKKRQQTIQF